jgi:hypothetical protein
MVRRFIDKGLSAGLLALSIPVLFTACGGDETKIQSSTTTTTMGQELMDLDRAYQQGIISKSEYERAKQDVLRRFKP